MTVATVSARFASTTTHSRPRTKRPTGEKNCQVGSQFNHDDPDGSDIGWELVGGTSSPLLLNCDLDGDCAAWFLPSVSAWVWGEPGSAAEFIPVETRHARYLGVDASSAIELDMSGSGTGVDDKNPVYGLAEVSPSDCGDAVCPFYLANLTAYNTTDTWNIGLPTLRGQLPKQIHNVQIDLLQSTLGVMNTSLGVVAFAPGALRMRVEFAVDSCSTCDDYADGVHAYIVENDEYVFADYDNNELDLIYSFSLPGNGIATLTIGVTPDEEPPEANHDLAASETCDDAGGLILGAHRSGSTDPDNDIAIEYWWVDGDPKPHGTVLAPGVSYLVALEAMDERGAVDRTADQSVYVATGPRCP